MSEKKGTTARHSGPTKAQLKKIDDYVLGPKDYEDIPELTDEWFKRADLYDGRQPSNAADRPRLMQNRR